MATEATEPVFRPMRRGDVRHVLALIDRESVRDARKSYSRRGLDGQFVLESQGRIIGCTGARPYEDTDRAFRLSWTYLNAPAGSAIPADYLLECLATELAGRNGRKLFAEVGSIDAPLAGGMSGGAQRSLTDAGFQRELTMRDYYDRGENLVVLSRRLREPQIIAQPDNPAGINIIDADEIEETDDAYYLDWKYADASGDQPERIEKWIDKIRRWRGRVVFVGVPSNAPGVLSALKDVGFYEEGRLRDLIADGLDEVRLRRDV